MRVSEILRVKGHALFTTPPDAPVLDAVKIMAQNDIGSLVVMNHGRMLGIVTFAEVLQALAEQGGSLGNLKISDVAEADPLTATPAIDVMELRRMMLERHQRYVPVLDGTTLLGVISFHDVAKAVYEEQSFENRMLTSYISDERPEQAARGPRSRRAGGARHRGPRTLSQRRRPTSRSAVWGSPR